MALLCLDIDVIVCASRVLATVFAPGRESESGDGSGGNGGAAHTRRRLLASRPTMRPARVVASCAATALAIAADALLLRRDDGSTPLVRARVRVCMCASV